MFSYGEGVSESRYHFLFVLPCVGDDGTSSSSPLSRGVKAMVLAGERSVEAVDDVDQLKVMWDDGWLGNEGAEMESDECNIGSKCALANRERDLG